MRYPTHELNEKDLPFGLYDILRASGGYFVGDIILDPIELPHLSLPKTINFQDKIIEQFNSLVVADGLGTYALHKNKKMLIISKLKAKPRDATMDEIMYDVDNFGEQVFWPKEFYAQNAGISLEEVEELPLQKFRFPKNSLFGDEEEFIYVGPLRASKYIFSTFIDQYPDRVPLERIEEILSGLDDENEELASGGLIVSMSSHGVTAPLKYLRKNQFGGSNEVLPSSFKDIDLTALNEGLENYLQKNKSMLKEHMDSVMQQHRQQQPNMFDFSNDGSLSRFYNFED